MQAKILATKSGMQTFFTPDGKAIPVTLLELKEAKMSNLIKEGEQIAVRGVSKGKGFAGVVKRHHFKGGPRTHGQSDRERAPGAIGSTTTPGRVLKGKRMAGRMGGEKVTVKNLSVVGIDKDKNILLVKGAVPGIKKGVVEIRKINDK